MENNIWKEHKFEEIMTITSSKRIFYEEYVQSGVPFYRSKEIIDLFNRRDIQTELFISEKRFDEIKNKFNLPNNYIVVSPSNSHNKKKRLNYRAWPHKNWKEFLNLLPKDKKVILIGAKGEEEFFEPLKPYNSNIIDLVGKVSISQMIAVLENAKALVVTDTGTAHIASAINTPVFCLIGPTPAFQTGPYKTPFNEVTIISAGLKCSPCYKTEVMKVCKDNVCMKNIEPSKVVDLLNQAKIL